MAKRKPISKKTYAKSQPKKSTSTTKGWSKPAKKIRGGKTLQSGKSKNIVRKNTGKTKTPNKTRQRDLHSESPFRIVTGKNNPQPEIKRKRGQNTIGYKLKSKKLENKISEIQNSKEAEKHLDYFQNKDRPKKGAGSKPPKGIIIILKGKKDQGEIAFVSPPDFVVNKKNVKAFTKGVLEKAAGEVYKRSDSKNRKNLWVSKQKSKFDVSGEPVNPTEINEVVIRYIYHK
jgi:hypothetical protein